MSSQKNNKVFASFLLLTFIKCLTTLPFMIAVIAASIYLSTFRATYSWKLHIQCFFILTPSFLENFDFSNSRFPNFLTRPLEVRRIGVQVYMTSFSLVLQFEGLVMISFSFIEDLPSCKDNYQSREHRCLWIWNGFRYTLLGMGISTMLLCRSNNVFQKARYRDDENVIHFWLLFNYKIQNVRCIPSFI